MKTEPTEALRAMANDLKYNTGVVQSNIKLVIEESFISGVKYGQSSPKIKQLEWKKSRFFEGDFEANFGLGKYFIDDCGGCITLVCPDHALKNKFSTIEEAKAAAQADFEQRVKECLE